MRIAHFTNCAIPTSTVPSSERTNLRTTQYPRAAPARVIPTNRKTETCTTRRKETSAGVIFFEKDPSSACLVSFGSSVISVPPSSSFYLLSSVSTVSFCFSVIIDKDILPRYYIHAINKRILRFGPENFSILKEGPY